MAEGSSSVLTAAIAGIAALTGTLGGAYFQQTGTVQASHERADADIKLAQQKFYSELVMKSLESTDPKDRLNTLTLLSETKIISDDSVREAISKYAEKNKDNPKNVPQVASANATLSPPVISNARIYLLAGSQQAASNFELLKKDLADGSYNVIGAKTLVDPLRSDGPEIRFFNREDEEQAQQLKGHLASRLSGRTAEAKLYQDSTARPGYIELWLGR